MNLSPARLPRLDRLPAIDGLRGVSVLLVMVSHLLEVVGVRWVPGGLGVTVFFVISGFVITRLLLAQAEVGPLSLGSFYLRRFFRLAPALLIYVLLCDLLLRAIGIGLPWGAVAAALFYGANYYNIYAEPMVLDASGVVSPLVVLWSLAIEEHFYLVFPLLLGGLLRRKPASLERALAAFIVVTLLWRCVLVFGTGIDRLPHDRIFMGSDTRLDAIAFGCWLAAAMHRAARPGQPGAQRLIEGLGGPRMVVAGGLLLLATLVLRQPEWRETLRYSLQCLALLPLLCALATGRRLPGGAQALLESRALLFLGAISYSLYLYHFLALVLARLLGAGDPRWLQIAVAAALGLAMATLSWLLIETPLRRSGARWADRLRHAEVPARRPMLASWRSDRS